MNDPHNLKNTDQSSDSLTRIILVDSFISRGRITEIPVEGSSVVCGENGVGKTSLLALVPAFYGASTHSSRKGNRSFHKSFVDYYLPRETSFIVYEYRRNGILNMSVFYRSDVPSTNYLFIRSIYKSDFFVDSSKSEGPVLRTVGGLREVLTNEQIPFTKKPIDHSTLYRNVIQGKLGLKDAQTYGMYSLSDCRMEEIGPIVRGILEKETGRDVKHVIVSSINEESRGSRDSIAVGIDSGKIQEFSGNLKEFRSISMESGTMDLLRNEKTKYLAIVQDLSMGMYKILRTMHSLGEQKSSVEKNLREVQSRKRSVDEEYQKKSNLFKNELIRLGVEIGISKDELGRIETTGKKFEEMNISMMLRESGNLQSLKREKEALEEKIRSFSMEVQSINLEYERQMLLLRENKDKSIDELTARLHEAKDEYSQTEKHLEYSFREKCSEIDKKKDSSIGAVQGDMGRLREERGGIESEIKNPVHDQEAIEKEQTLLSRIQVSMDSHRKAETNCSEKTRSLEKTTVEIDSTNKKLTILDDSISKARKSLSEFLLKMDSDETFLFFLKKEVPEWEKTIGLILDDSVLERTDLAPMVSSRDGSLYGVDINLSALPSRNTVDDFDRKKATLERAIGDREEEILTVKKLRADLFVRKESESSELASLETEVNRVRYLIEDLNKSLADHRSSMAESIKRKVENLKLRREKTDADIGLLNETIRKVSESALSEKNHLESEWKIQTETKRKSLQSSLDEINGLIKSKNDEYLKNMSRLESEKADILLKKGIDPQIILTARKELENVVASVLRIEGYAGDLSRHKEYMENDFPRIEPIKENLRNLEKEKEGIVGNEKASEDAYKRETQSINQLILDRKNEFEGIVKRFGQMECLSKKFSDKYPPIAVDVSENIENVEPFIHEFTRKDDDATKLRDGMERKTRSVLDKFRHASYDPIKNFASEKLNDSNQEVLFFRLSEWFEKERLYLLSLLILSFDGIMNEFTEVRRKISTFSSELKKREKRINQIIADSDQFSFKNMSIQFDVDVDSHIPGWRDAVKFEQQVLADKESDHLIDEERLMFYASGNLRAIEKMANSHGSKTIRLTDLFSVSGRFHDKNGDQKVFSNLDVEGISSNGLTRLIVTILSISLIVISRGRSSHRVLIVEDELRDIDAGNVYRLMDILERNNIGILAGFPDPDSIICQRFERTYTFSPTGRFTTLKSDRKSGRKKEETSIV